MKEVWKDIQGYEGIYQVSNLGKVKSLDRFIRKKGKRNGVYHIKEKILKSSTDDTGYLQVNLSKNGIYEKVHIHRLVAKAFIKNPYKKLQVNHIDGNRINSMVNNLEWVTDSENKFHAWKNLPRKSLKRKVYQISKDNQIIKEWESIKEAQNSLKITHISECCRGKYKTSGGYVWKYKKEEK